MSNSIEKEWSKRDEYNKQLLTKGFFLKNKFKTGNSNKIKKENNLSRRIWDVVDTNGATVLQYYSKNNKARFTFGENIKSFPVKDFQEVIDKWL